MHNAAVGYAFIFAVGRHNAAHGFYPLHNFQHDAIVHHPVTIVSECDSVGPERRGIDRGFAIAAEGEGGVRQNVYHRLLFDKVALEADMAYTVRRGV